MQVKSPLPPYDAARWVNCPGSVMLQTLNPPIETGQPDNNKEEGRAFHAKSQQLLNTYVTGERSEPGLVSQIDTLCDNGVLFSQEMYDAVMVYTGDVFHYANEHGLLNQLKVEDRIEIDDIYQGVFGFCDCHVINKSKKEMVFWDAKYGHRIVEAFENWQLICYVIGKTKDINGHEDQKWTIKLRVSQPRAPHSLGVNREWSVSLAELRSYFNIVIAAANDALSGDGKCKTGPHCGNCTARYACDTLDRDVYALAQYIGNASNQLTGKALGVEYLLLDRFETLLKARKSGIEEQCIAELRQGEVIPGLMTEERLGRKRWCKDINKDEVIMMGDAMGVDLRKPQELDTPSQCAKKGIDESVIEAYSEIPRNGYKLVKDDGTRARMVFK